MLEPDLELTLRPVPKTEPVVLLAHEPDIANAVSHYPVDLQLSGHSKSGFVRGEPGDRSGSKVERLASSASCPTFAWETPAPRLCRSHSCLLLSNEAEAGVSPLRK